MKNKVLRLLLPLVLMVLAAFSAAVCAAAASDPADSAESYENPDTGYRVVIADEKNLLTRILEFKFQIYVTKIAFHVLYKYKN